MSDDHKHESSDESVLRQYKRESIDECVEREYRRAPIDTTVEREKVDWLVMVYLAGDNNLAEECVYALTDMRKVGSTTRMAVFAELDTGVHENTPLFITKSKNPGSTNTELQQVRNQMRRRGPGPKLAYSDVLYEFVRNCIQRYEAKHHMFVISGHSNGIIENFLRKEEADEIESLSMLSFGGVIEDIDEKLLDRRKIDILGLDSCMMGMSEIAYVVHNHAKVMIGAEGFEPRAGWSYEHVLTAVDAFAGNGNRDVRSLARQIVCDYIQFYTDYQAAGVSVDMSACDLEICTQLMWGISSLAQCLGEHLPYDRPNEDLRRALILAHWEAQPYKNEQYVDLYDFCERLQTYCPRSIQRVHTVCQNVMNAIRGAANFSAKVAAQADANFTSPRTPKEFRPHINFQDVKPFILGSCYSGLTVQYSFGISIYFPWAEQPAELERYKQLHFVNDSGWLEFLRKYLHATKRSPRPGIGEISDFDDNVTSDQFVISTSNFFFDHRSGTPNKSGSPNKSGTPNKDLGNVIGTMRNPPTQFFQCDCKTDNLRP